MHTPWVRFSKTGEPDPENWPKYDGYNTEIRIFDRKTATRLVRRKELMDVWGDLGIPSLALTEGTATFRKGENVRQVHAL